MTVELFNESFKNIHEIRLSEQFKFDSFSELIIQNPLHHWTVSLFLSYVFITVHTVQVTC